MSLATDMLAVCQTAYQKALTGETVWFGDRRFTAQNIGALLSQLKYWEQRVAQETANAGGQSYRKPIQVVL